jgi:ribokinase
VILNPAPAEKIPVEYFEYISFITPNQTEAALLTGLNSTKQNAIADWLREKGVDTVIITLGEKGAYFNSGRGRGEVPGFNVKVLDTTAAGDAFNAGLAVAVSQGLSTREAIHFANAVGALSVTKMGAQPSLPFRTEVDNLLRIKNCQLPI